jgi:hypothetical protein
MGDVAKAGKDVHRPVQVAETETETETETDRDRQRQRQRQRKTERQTETEDKENQPMAMAMSPKQARMCGFTVRSRLPSCETPPLQVSEAREEVVARDRERKSRVTHRGR